MKVRQHLRAWAIVSLLVQSAWLFAIVPADCCAAHTTATPERACHEEVQASHCTMAHGGGAACPMHQAGTSPSSSDDCRLRGTCAGPMSAFLTLLAAHGVLPTPLETLTSLPLAGPSLDRVPQAVNHFVPPDAPPPRL
jgi:hypothetical protein